MINGSVNLAEQAGGDAQRRAAAFRRRQRADFYFVVGFAGLVVGVIVVGVLAFVGGILLLRVGLGLLAKGGF